MKFNIYTLGFLLLIGSYGFAQSFNNGDFEVNKSSTCDYNLTDSVFNKRMSNVHAFGKRYTFGNKHYGEMDIQTFDCYVNPQNGNWCVGLGTDTTTDAIAIQLNSNLEIGQSYKLSFHVFGNTSFFSSTGNLIIGESLTDSTFGSFIDSISPIAMSWKEVILNFTASQTSKYITVKNALGVRGWNQVDNFSISKITSTNEIQVEKPKLFPNPTSNFTSIQIDNSSRFLSATIRNTIGEMVLTTKSLKIDVSLFSSGIYFIEIATDKGKYLNQLLKI